MKKVFLEDSLMEDDADDDGSTKRERVKIKLKLTFITAQPIATYFGWKVDMVRADP